MLRRQKKKKKIFPFLYRLKLIITVVFRNVNVIEIAIQDNSSRKIKHNVIQGPRLYNFFFIDNSAENKICFT